MKITKDICGRPGWLGRLFLNLISSLIVEGYEDENGFHYGKKE